MTTKQTQKGTNCFSRIRLLFNLGIFKQPGMKIALIYNMNTKVCSKCEVEKDVSCFSKGNGKNGLQYKCKSCNKLYRKNNESQITKYQKQYYENNKPQLLQAQKQYKKDNTPRLTKYRKQYRKNNAPRIAKQQKQYHKQRNKCCVLFETYSKRLEVFEKIRPCPKNSKLLEVKCAYCGKWTKPSNRQVSTRLQAFNGTTEGENRFYCSENCKQACPIYNQNKYPKGFKKATSREVVPLLRQIVLERDDYTCQKCGATTKTAQLHVHHEKSYTLNKMMANDPDNCWTLCKNCHLWVHSREGCKTVDLRCIKKEKN